jgi:hypothetical protein
LAKRTKPFKPLDETTEKGIATQESKTILTPSGFILIEDGL